MAKYDTNGFDPHYWEKCYVFRCKKGECPFVSLCFAAQAKDHKETKTVVQSLEDQISKGEKTTLTPQERLTLAHATEKHGIETFLLNQ